MTLIFQRRGHGRTLIAASTALLILAALVIPVPVGPPLGQARAIDVTARQFAFEPSTLQVRRGDTVTIHLESLDAVHGLYIDGYDVQMETEPGRSSTVTFVADREGKFKVRCSIACGPLHPFMIAEMVVTPDWPLARALIATVIAAVGATVVFWNK